MSKVFLSIFILFIHISATQAKTMKQYEANLIRLYIEDEQFVNSSDERRKGKDNEFDTFWLFKKELQKVLSKKESVNYAFDSLGEHISIQQSRDKRFRTFSWYAGGGSGYSFNQVFQYVDDYGQVHVEIVESEYDFNENFWQMNQVEINNSQVYILFGWSSWGGGKYCHSVFAFDSRRKNLFSAMFSVILPV